MVTRSVPYGQPIELTNVLLTLGLTVLLVGRSANNYEAETVYIPESAFLATPLTKLPIYVEYRRSQAYLCGPQVTSYA